MSAVVRSYAYPFLTDGDVWRRTCNPVVGLIGLRQAATDCIPLNEWRLHVCSTFLDYRLVDRNRLIGALLLYVWMVEYLLTDVHSSIVYMLPTPQENYMKQSADCTQFQQPVSNQKLIDETLPITPIFIYEAPCMQIHFLLTFFGCQTRLLAVRESGCRADGIILSVYGCSNRSDNYNK